MQVYRDGPYNAVCASRICFLTQHCCGSFQNVFFIPLISPPDISPSIYKPKLYTKLYLKPRAYNRNFVVSYIFGRTLFYYYLYLKIIIKWYKWGWYFNPFPLPS